MRHLVALVFCFLLTVPQAQACLGARYDLFFDAIPEPLPDTDVIAKVSLSNITGEGYTATATILQLLGKSDSRVHQGDAITLVFPGSSCFYTPPNGNEGIIIAKLRADSDGSFLLHPYSHGSPSGIVSPDIDGTNSHVNYFKTKCVFPNIKFPEDMLIYTVGSNYGRRLDFQIDPSGQMAHQFDVTVNNLARPVALMLFASSAPTIWNIQWTKGTKIVAIFTSGNYKQAVAGLDSSVPILNSNGGCGSNRFETISQQLFGKPPDYLDIKNDRKSSIIIGEPPENGTRLITSSAVTPLSFWDKNAPLAGELGLKDAVAKGLLRPATEEDVTAWNAATTHPNPPRWVPLVREFRAYVVLKEFTFPPGMNAARSTTFFIPKDVPLPKGNPGSSSKVYDFNSLRHWCFDNTCKNWRQNTLR
ncbi:MAG: hypothetical protein LBV44_05340 [Methylobacillus sp.]|nr:hypothetical protein [Methylobacillus sp.]